MIEKLKAQLRRHEGFVSRPKPCPTGHMSGGFGHNFEAHNEFVPEIVSPKMAEDYLDGDIRDAVIGCSCYIGPFIDLDPVRQAVLINMAFNMGIKGLLKFKNMLEAIKNQDWQMASLAMINSLWAMQVKGRAQELARMMETGKWPEEVEG